MHVQIHAEQNISAEAHRSQSFQLDKDNNKEGCALTFEASSKVMQPKVFKKQNGLLTHMVESEEDIEKGQFL